VPRVFRGLTHLSVRGSLGLLLALLFFGAIFWAKGRDPFRRIWFKVETKDYGKTECVAVLPKSAKPPYAVAIYLHGSGGSVLNSGNELRQIAEMGLAVIGMDYSQTNVAGFEEQFAALNNWVFGQKWADTNRVAWVGFSLGAQRALDFALKSCDRVPALLVLVSGGGSQLLDTVTNPITLGPRLSTLLIHGDKDDISPMTDVTHTAARLQSNGIPVETRVLHGIGNGLDPHRLIVFREIGEYCLAHLKGADALFQYRSILSRESEVKPLWLYWLPAAIWASVWITLNQRRAKPLATDLRRPFSKWEIGLRWFAGIAIIVAIGQTTLHLVPPWLPVSDRTLAVARKYLIRPKELSDFEFLAKNSIWQTPIMSKNDRSTRIRPPRLGIVLTHVELANYNREIINWKLDEQIYRDFVLSPKIDSALDGDLNWRRELWENFYPRIRKENTTVAAAEIIVRFLRERVTVVPSLGVGVKDSKLPTSIADAWKQQKCDAHGFEAIYVAAMRSAGVPARLAPNRRAEFWTGSDWQSAPRPIVQSFLQ
jgi:dienelactone hydrolase